MSVPAINTLHQLFRLPQKPKRENVMQQYRANSLAQPPKLRQAMQSGKILLGTGIAIPSVNVATTIAQLGYDWAFIDLEHAPMSPAMMVDLIKTIHFYSEGKTAAVVRLPTHGHEWISWALDAGAAGLVFPHTDTAEQARKAVQNAKFGPWGTRSFPPWALLPGQNDDTPEGKSVFDVWNENAAIIMQIESAEGVRNASEIAAVEGVDSLMVGPTDLRFDMGLPGMYGVEPEFNEAIAAVDRAAKANSIPIAGFAFGPAIKTRIEWGWSILMVSSDLFALTAAESLALAEAQASADAARGLPIEGTKEQQKAIAEADAQTTLAVLAE